MPSPATPAARRAALRRRLHLLARTFVDAVVDAVSEELEATQRETESVANGSQGRSRRPKGELLALRSELLEAIESQPDISIGELAHHLATTPRRLSQPLKQLVERGAILRAGEKKGARYRVSAARKRAKRGRVKTGR